jgi:Cof subfamily protein (haloacid dehalogenase superfamily)
MKYKAIALDLDGTLTDSEKNVSDVNIEACKKAIEKGVKVILASGRPLFGVEPVADILDLKNLGGYILAYNGGNIVDCRTGKLLVSYVMPEGVMKDICEESKKAGVYPLTYYGDKVISESDMDPYVLEEARCNGAKVMKVDNLEKFVDYEVAKILVAGPHEKLLPLQERLIKLHGDVIDVFFSQDIFLELVPKNVAKSTSLDELLGRIGVKREELIACGDGANDVPMLQYAGLSVAMENAYPEVKRYADFIAPSNDDDGVAYVIEKFILNGEEL